jgi:hypothetical protein
MLDAGYEAVQNRVDRMLKAAKPDDGCGSSCRGRSRWIPGAKKSPWRSRLVRLAKKPRSCPSLKVLVGRRETIATRHRDLRRSVAPGAGRDQARAAPPFLGSDELSTLVEEKMQDIELRIPVELTASRIQGHAQISAETAHQMAIELHGIVGAYRQLFAVRPPCGCFVDNEETDVVETILRTAVDVLPRDGDVRGRESAWLYERFSAVDGDELYDRYLRFFDQINGTDLADELK